MKMDFIRLELDKVVIILVNIIVISQILDIYIFVVWKSGHIYIYPKNIGIEAEKNRDDVIRLIWDRNQESKLSDHIHSII